MSFHVSGDEYDVVIRRIRPDEVEVYRVFRLRALADAPDAFSDTYSAASTRPPGFWQDRVAMTAAGVHSVLVVASDAVGDAWLGMTGCYLDQTDSSTAHVVSVWVAPEARRRGLARRLLDGAVEWARCRGATTACLWVTETNLGARTLYLNAGFVPSGRSGNLPSNAGLRELEMSRAI